MVDVLGLTIVIPFLPFYAQKFGASPFVVGLLVTSYATCQLISGPILGYFSDKIGRRPVLLFSQIGTLIGFIILARAQSLWMVFLSRVIDGSTAGNLSVAQAYISDVTEPKNRAKAFGIIGVAFGLGFLVGPAVSGYLSQFGFQHPVYAAAGLSLTSILATYFLLPESPPIKADPAEEEELPAGRRLGIWDWGRYKNYFKDDVLSPLLLQFFAFAFSFSMFISGFALFAERRFTYDGMPFGPREVGYIFAYTGFLGIILQGGLIGRLVNKYGEEKLALAGFLTSTIGYGCLSFTTSIPGLIAVATIASFGSGVLRPAITSLISKNAPRREQGVVLGLTQSMNSVAQIGAPLIAGGLIEYGLLSPWALLAAASSFAGFFLILRFRAIEAQAGPSRL